MPFSCQISGLWLSRIAITSALLAWILLIYYLSSLSYTDIETVWSAPPTQVTWIPESMGDIHIQGHLAVFGVLAWLTLSTIQCWRGSYVHLLRWSILAVAFSVGYGVVDELHQSAVPGRIASVLDVGIDALGAVAGVVAWRVISAWSGHRTLDDKAAYSARTTQAYRGN